MPQKLAANAYTSPVKTVRRLELEDLDGTREMLPLGSPTSPSQADISRIAGNYQVRYINKLFRPIIYLRL